MKAYQVEEDWKTTKTGTVWAETAEEAKDKWRDSSTPEEEILVHDEYAEPRGIRARREPSEDR